VARDDVSRKTLSDPAFTDRCHVLQKLLYIQSLRSCPPSLGSCSRCLTWSQFLQRLPDLVLATRPKQVNFTCVIAHEETARTGHVEPLLPRTSLELGIRYRCR
jgi:hypothetical protein